MTSAAVCCVTYRIWRKFNLSKRRILIRPADQQTSRYIILACYLSLLPTSSRHLCIHPNLFLDESICGQSVTVSRWPYQCDFAVCCRHLNGKPHQMLLLLLLFFLSLVTTPLNVIFNNTIKMHFNQLQIKPHTVAVRGPVGLEINFSNLLYTARTRIEFGWVSSAFLTTYIYV